MLAIGQALFGVWPSLLRARFGVPTGRRGGKAPASLLPAACLSHCRRRRAELGAPAEARRGWERAQRRVCWQALAARRLSKVLRCGVGCCLLFDLCGGCWQQGGQRLAVCTSLFGTGCFLLAAGWPFVCSSAESLDRWRGDWPLGQLPSSFSISVLQATSITISSSFGRHVRRQSPGQPSSWF